MNVQRLNALIASDFKLVEPAKPVAEAPPSGPSFGEVLSKALSAVEQDQAAAKQAVTKLATGEVTDVAEVMIASERANLSLGLAVQVRNKLLEAYQDIMRTPL